MVSAPASKIDFLSLLKTFLFPLKQLSDYKLDCFDSRCKMKIYRPPQKSFRFSLWKKDPTANERADVGFTSGGLLLKTENRSLMGE